MKKISFLILILLSVCFCSCDSFLDIIPKGKLIPKTLADYDGMLKDPLNSTAVGYLTDVSSDNVEIPAVSEKTALLSPYGRAYYWYDYFYESSENDIFWDDAYNIIYTMNIVLDNVDKATEGNEVDRKRVEAEARTNRAYYYWMLLNTYAKNYDASTALTDLGVPIILKPNLEAQFSRSTVKEVVGAILEDLSFDPEWLPIIPEDSYRITRASLYALLARIYLHLGQYDMALENADLALGINDKLLDYNTYSFMNPDKPTTATIVNRPKDINSPEKLMCRESNFPTLMSSYNISQSLEALYGDESDLRLKFNFSNKTSSGDTTDDGRKRYLNPVCCSIGVPEMMLIKAECLARKNDVKALDILNTLRKNRIATAAFKPLTDNNNLLLQVLEERERELACNGMRWFDMKRLAKEGLYTKAITRSNSNYSRTLKPNSDYYVFPISSKVIRLNPKIIQNKR